MNLKSYNALQKAIETLAAEMVITYRHGRVGQEQEYYEFDPNRVDQTLYVAQKSGPAWFIFKVWPGKKGRVLTVGSLITNIGEVAALLALDACNRNVELAGVTKREGPFNDVELAKCIAKSLGKSVPHNPNPPTQPLKPGYLDVYQNKGRRIPRSKPCE